MFFDKPKRVSDQEYLRFLHGFGCALPDCGQWPVDAHHVTTRGAGGSDYECVPLCRPHHQKFHQMGIESFKNFYKVSFDELTKKFVELYNTGVQGPYISRVPKLETKSHKPELKKKDKPDLFKSS